MVKKLAEILIEAICDADLRSRSIFVSALANRITAEDCAKLAAKVGI